MILADSSKWIDHLRKEDSQFYALLRSRRILFHPLVLGELGMGMIKNRQEVLEDISRLPKAIVARDQEVMRFVETHALFGRGIGFIDAHLLVSCKLTDGSSLWTEDRRLREAAELLGIRFDDTTGSS